MSEYETVRLTVAEKQFRKSVALIMASSVKDDPTWGNNLISAWLFGSLARNEGHVGSDVDIAFCVSRNQPFTSTTYLDTSTLLRETIDGFRNQLNIPFPVSPTLLDNNWLKKPHIALIYPSVVQSIVREGVRLL